MHSALNASRSVQTIRDSTSTIATIPLPRWNDSLQIRQLNKGGALGDQHFIITIKSDVDDASFSVKPFAELIVLNNRLRFVVMPENQYPHIVDSESDVFTEIERSLANFLKNNYDVDVSLVRNYSPVEMRVANQWHLR